MQERSRDVGTGGRLRQGSAPVSPEAGHPVVVRKGRGAVSNGEGRFATTRSTPFDDGWGMDPLADAGAPGTTVQPDATRRIIARNQSPDVPFDRSINPYKGCEHGCVYCFARPTHAYLDLSPGLDFETRLFFKRDAADRLRDELAAPGYRPRTLAMGTNTDPWQPVERQLGVTRSILEVLDATAHPLSIVTKGALLERDLDLLESMARRQLVSVMISITTLDAGLKRILEPRAMTPSRRLALVRTLRERGIPVGVMVAPVIPWITDHELEAIVAAAADAGAGSVRWILLRLPWEVKALFSEWLQVHFPDRAERVLASLRDLHGGREYDPRFGQRQTGTGPLARLLEARFRAALRRAGLEGADLPPLRTDLFRPPVTVGAQLALF